MARKKQKKSKIDRAWNRLVLTLGTVEDLLFAADENVEEINTLRAENKTLSKKLAVYDKVLGKLPDNKTTKAKKHGKHRGRPKGSKNAAKTVKATKTVKKTAKPKTVKATKTPAAPKTEATTSAPALAPATTK